MESRKIKSETNMRDDLVKRYMESMGLKDIIIIGQDKVEGRNAKPFWQPQLMGKPENNPMRNRHSQYTKLLRDRG